jgi:hypothetical protein
MSNQIGSFLDLNVFWICGIVGKGVATLIMLVNSQKKYLEDVILLDIFNMK